MAKRRFSNVDRRSIIEAYGPRCFHCCAPIDYLGFEIDHLIPEGLAANPSKFAEVLARYDLPADFDLNCDENLVPSCRTCNGKKSDLLLNPNQIAIHLAVTRSQAPKVAELRIKFGKQTQTNRLFQDLLRAYEAGTTNPHEIKRLTWQYYGQSTVMLSHPLSFVRAPELKILCQADIEDLRDAELLIFDTPGGINLVHDDGCEREVRTCRQYSEAICEGFYAITNSAIKLSSMFDTTLHVLHALENAEPAERSFVSEPRIGLCDLRFLPMSLVQRSPDFATEGTVTIEEASSNGILEVVDFSSLSLTVSCGHMITTFRELMRSDLNGDGVEELLVAVFARADGGTMGYGYCITLGRHSEEELLKDLMVMLPHDIAARNLALQKLD